MGRKVKASGSKGNITPGMNISTPGFRKIGNEAFSAAMSEKARSSATAPHMPKAYKGSRSANKKKAINDGH